MTDQFKRQINPELRIGDFPHVAPGGTALVDEFIVGDVPTLPPDLLEFLGKQMALDFSDDAE